LPLRGDPFNRYILNVGAGAGVFEGNGANLSICIQIEDRVLVQFPGLPDSLGLELDVKRIGVFEIHDFHGLYRRSKNALCTVSPSGSKMTLRYRPPISSIRAHRQILPSS
jgi:hypothetical protein